MPSKDIAKPSFDGCSAGCSDAQGEGGISDPDLAAVVTAWPTLPDALKAGILAMIRAAGKGD